MADNLRERWQMQKESKDWSKMTVDACRDELHRMYSEAMNPPELMRAQSLTLRELLAKAKAAKGITQPDGS